MQQKNTDLMIEATHYNLEEKDVVKLIGNLSSIESEREAYVTQYEEITTLDIEDPNTSKRAKEIRIKIRDNRTKGIAVWHKTTKDYFLKASQFIDAVKRKMDAVNIRMEENLEQIEKYAEIKRQKEIKSLHDTRLFQLNPFVEFVPFIPPHANASFLGEMTQEDFEKLLNGARYQFEAKVEAERKKKEEMEIAEKNKVEVQKKFQQLLPYRLWIENFENLNFLAMPQEEVDKLEIQAKKQFELELEQTTMLEKRNAEIEEEARKKEAEIKKMAQELEDERARMKALELKLSEKEKVAQPTMAKSKPYSVYQAELNKISKIPQTQVTLQKQLSILHDFAVKLGLYHAADFLKKQ